jgi:UPF0716 protein FxsA
MKILLTITLVLSLLVFELYLLMHSSAYFGVNQTLLFVVVSALCGILVIRVQGLANIKKMRATLSQGGLPTGALFESIFILAGGIALLLPGFITDVAGMMLLIPLLRRYLLLTLFKSLI